MAREASPGVGQGGIAWSGAGVKNQEFGKMAEQILEGPGGNSLEGRGRRCRALGIGETKNRGGQSA
ncbi:MAG: hypothetical protein LBQ79_10315 [Deltaproteobacteria bacterium]|jgi:hypothetical protein|nr:hypothetical protein [Deltaproteobacteria bacterium]